MIVDGFFAEIWSELSGRLNFTYEFVLPKDNIFGILNANGTYTTGLFGMLMEKEIDVIVVDIIITEERMRFVDYSVPIISFGQELFILKKLFTNVLNFIFSVLRNQIYFTHLGDRLEWGSWLKPFSTEVWLVLLAWVAVVSLFLAILYRMGCFFNFEKVTYKREFTIFGAFFITVRAITYQGWF